jgi:hypothetical protein
MIRLLWKAPLLVAFSLFTSAATAYAECAWVLWWEDTTSSSSYRTADANVPGANTSSREGHSWNILGSYPTSAACERQQASKIEAMLKMWRKEKAEATFGQHTIDHESGGNIISRRSEYVSENTSNLFSSLRYLCLPDTVDPRGPKGK